MKKQRIDEPLTSKEQKLIEHLTNKNRMEIDEIIGEFENEFI